MNKIFCIHPSINNLFDLVDYLKIENMSFNLNLVWSEESPDYLFVSEHIYLNGKYMKKFRKYAKNKEIIKIYIAGECIASDFNIFDYAITFDRNIKNEDRVCRIPTKKFFRSSIVREKNDVDYLNAKKILLNKKGFCCFIYSNPNSHPMRDNIFKELCKYKKVDSLGKHMNNTHIKQTRNSKNWRELSIDMKSRYKFSIAAENACYNGYVSEKILTSFQSHSIPIYWGDNTISDEFNPEAYINVNDFSTFEDLRLYIKKIDEDDDLWCKIVSQPWQTEQQCKYEKELEERYFEFIENIFKQNKQNAKRVPSGTYPELYSCYYFNPMMSLLKSSLLGKVLKKLKILE